MSRIKQSFTDEFKDQIVALYNSGKKPAEILREYNPDTADFQKVSIPTIPKFFLRKRHTRNRQNPRIQNLASCLSYTNIRLILSFCHQIFHLQVAECSV